MQTTEAIAKGQKIFDREYTGLPVTLLASAARTANGTATSLELLAYQRALILLDVTDLANVAGDTLDVYIDLSPDGGTTWVNAVHFPQQLGNGAAAKYVAVLCADNPGADTIDVTSDAAAAKVRPTLVGNRVRVRYVIVDGGAHGQSFTFSVQAILQ